MRWLGRDQIGFNLTIGNRSISITPQGGPIDWLATKEGDEVCFILMFDLFLMHSFFTLLLCRNDI